MQSVKCLGKKTHSWEGYCKGRKINIEMRVLEARPFKFKTPLVEFFCPLCRSQRALTQTYKLFPRHYAQLFLLTLVTFLLLYPLLKWRGFFIFFIYWPLLELTRRAVYRSEIACPYCGFDAVLYKKNVKMAQESVKKFWQKASETDNSHKNSVQTPAP